MRRGTCVKCGAATVRAAANGIEMGDRPSQTFLRPNIGPGFRGMVRNHSAQLWAFGCATCGYVELHLADPSALAFIAEHWVPVPAEPSPG